MATLVFAAVPAVHVAMAQTTGVSHPDDAPIVATSDDATPAKPVAATPAAPAAATTETFGPYVPYKSATTPLSKQAFDPDAHIVTTSASAASASDEDAGIVTSVPEREGEIREGTLLKARINESLSTTSTLEGSRFTAPLAQDVLQNGRVVIPAGSVLEGRVTEVHGGRRISGAAALHLEARTVTLPDGTRYSLRAQLIDTDQEHDKLTSEGTVTHRDHPKENAGVLALTAGSGAAAGALMAGPAGALVGAGVGAGVSTVLWLKQDRQAALPQGSMLVFSLVEPLELRSISNGVGGTGLVPRTTATDSPGGAQ
ncbi:MAG: hypothetical protein KGK08_02555 [Acidobacteriota bacterium]|nr:hypothetical protein [Acidobacteriota bacterium]